MLGGFGERGPQMIAVTVDGRGLLVESRPIVNRPTS